MTGRIGVYVHSDSVAPDKGACLVVVRTLTDFASRTQQVKDFADKIAKHAFGASVGRTMLVWKNVTDMFPDMEVERGRLSEELKEKVQVSEIMFLKV